MYAEDTQAGAHHEGVRLADEIRADTGGHLDRGDHRAAGGDDALLRGAGEVAVRADELCALIHELYSLEYILIVIGVALAYDDIVGVDIVHGDALIVQGKHYAGAADDISAASGSLTADKARGRLSTGVEMLLVNIQPHAPELLLKLLRRALG